MSQREGQLRAIVLIAIVAVSAIVVGSVLFLASTALGVIGVLATLAFGLFSVYTHYFELPEGVSDTIHSVEIDESQTAGTRPAAEAEGFDLNVDDIVLSQLPPKRVAQVIYNSPGWHSDGHGGYSTFWRPRLRRLFHSEVFSNKTFELSLLGLTMGSLVLLYFVFLSFFPDNMTMAYIEPLTEVYPANQPVERTQLVVGVSIAIAVTGIAYFEIKSGSTCPVCRSPFALESKKRFFRPENREVVVRSQNEGSEKREVTYGVHIFHCKSCGSWNIPTKRWERSLESQGL
jgi:hypothetical protein